MKNNLIIDVDNLLCKKEVILSKEDIIQVALFALQNNILKLSIFQDGDYSNIGEFENGYKIVFDNTDSFIMVQH